MYKGLITLTRYWPLLLLVVLTVILRLINIEKLFYFTYDESIPAFVGRRLLLWNHLPLIGGVTPFGFHLAPYFYWLLSSLLILGKLNPIIWGYASALIAAGTTLMIYLVGKKFANKKVGFSASILWCFSYLANIYDRHLWALYWGPLLSLIVVFSLYQIIKKRENFLFLLAPALAFGMSVDPSNFVHILLAITVWVSYRLPVNKKTLLAFLLFSSSFLPLAIFDLRHNFSNTKPALDFIKKGRNNPGFNVQNFTKNSLLFPRAFSRLAYTFGDNEVAKQYSYCSYFVSEKFKAIPVSVQALSTFTILGFLIWAFKNRRGKPQWTLTGLLVALYFFGIQIYGTVFAGDIFEHYLTGLFSIFLLIAAFLISHLPKKIWLVILAIFVAANLYKLSLGRNSQGLTFKRLAIEYTMQQAGDKPFSLDSLSTCWKQNGYRYLFAVFGSEPVKSYVDPNFGYLYGTTLVWDKHPKTVVAFILHDFAPETNNFYKRYALLKSHETSSRLFGNIEVIIMDNSANWFR